MTEHPVPRPLRVAGGAAWRLLAVAAAVYVVALVVANLRLVFLPVFAALLLATFLTPPARWLMRHKVPAALAALLALCGALVVLAGVLAAVSPQVADEVGPLDVGVSGGVERVEEWLVDGPLGLPERRVADVVDRVEEQLRANAGMIAGGFLSGAVIALELVAGALLTMVILFFFLKDGERIWSWALGLFPPSRRGDAAEVGARAWETLGGFLRGTAIVGTFNAFFIGLALFLIGVPLVIPLALLTFFGSFIPIVGAFVAGFAAVMVALVSEGFVSAVIVLGVILFVQQVEGNVLQPYVLGKSLRLHPVVVLLAVTTGGIVWGIIGAFVAVPVTAVIVETASYLRTRSSPEVEIAPPPAAHVR